ncbi:MAG: hypothetical protein ACPG32_10340 [Akkermansiaceae bacterium]
MKKLIIFLLAIFTPIAAIAGSRGLDIAFIDATASNTTPEGKRLAELLVMDMRKLYAAEKHAALFPWSEDLIKIKTTTAASAGLKFDRLLNTKDAKKIKLHLEKNRVQDGAVVFYYDRANGVARLKLFDSEGAECLLLRLPLEGKTSAMKHSILKHNRRGALVALGANVRWSP